MDGQREARKRETADVQMEKEEKNEHLKLLIMPRTVVPFYFTKLKKKNYKNIFKK